MIRSQTIFASFSQTIFASWSERGIALPGCSTDVALAARRIRSTFQEKAYLVEGRPVGATVSVGVATAPEHGASLAEIVASSDVALYRAKDLGGNRVILAAPNSLGGDAATVIRIA